MTQDTQSQVQEIVNAEMAKLARQEIHAAFNGLRELLESIEINMKTQNQEKFNSALYMATLLLKTLERDFMMTGLTNKEEMIFTKN
jgi:phosphotransacetylase